jgi:carbamoyltransferase
MRVLGLGGLDHNGSATVLDDGEVTSFLELERVTRRKNQGLDSPEALDALLDRLRIDTVDHVAIADIAWQREHATWLTPWLSRRFGDVPWSVHGHHHCHLACGFVASPFERATVISIDGKGDGWSAAAGSCSRAVAPEVEMFVPSAHSLGRLWWAASEYAGLPGHHAAGKTMALAAYGEPRFVDAFVRHTAPAPDGGFRFLPPEDEPDLFRQVPRIVAWMARVTGRPPAAPGAHDGAHCDMAASVQRLTEDLVERLVAAAVLRSGERAVCLAGGVALNGLVSQRLIARRVVDALYVPPCTDDRGLSLGAASLAAWAAGDGVRAAGVPLSPYLGPTVSCADAPDDLDEVVARLVRGEVLGWFEGADEAGPRALGHRSILASPRFPWMRDHINERVKRRESFRPFGCSVLREEVGAWFDCDDDSPYMLRIVGARRERRAEIPAVLHVDGTSRLHTVTSREAPRLAALLARLRAFGHPPLLLNTSLNGRGEPVAHTVSDSLSVAGALRLDGIVVEGRLHAQGGGR